MATPKEEGPKSNETWNDIKSMLDEPDVKKLFTTQQLSDQDAVKNNRVAIYNGLKNDDDLRKKGYSYKFAAWVLDELKLNDEELKSDQTKIDSNHGVTYLGDIKPMFTDCDQWNMKTKRGLDLHDYTAVVKNYGPIYGKVKNRSMPMGGPKWSDIQINMLPAWKYEGYKDSSPQAKNNTDVMSYMEPYFPEYKIDGVQANENNLKEALDQNKNFDGLTFDFHIKPMFALGHRDKMFDVTSGHIDLHDFVSVNEEKVNILFKLTLPNIMKSGKKRMPQRNPWPKKNIYLFYAWAKQGETSKKGVTSTIKDEYNPNDLENPKTDLGKMHSYYVYYRDLPDIHKDS
ncbi:17657_t:CDS:1 [Racocetra fulgida]|uniref:17657_t:CDS:1 n=1 Tax=Racocetra fulgida TaxID=60492 RepID=A0A9N9H3E7_9GLOM|nr:17657_t:CDS:1 [Racocetra fulgida]